MSVAANTPPWNAPWCHANALPTRTGTTEALSVCGRAATIQVLREAAMGLGSGGLLGGIAHAPVAVNKQGRAAGQHQRPERRADTQPLRVGGGDEQREQAAEAVLVAGERPRERL